MHFYFFIRVVGLYSSCFYFFCAGAKRLNCRSKVFLSNFLGAVQKGRAFLRLKRFQGTCRGFDDMVTSIRRC